MFCLCIMCMPVAFGVEKRASDPLELALQMVVSHRMGTGNGTRASERAASAFHG